MTVVVAFVLGLSPAGARLPEGDDLTDQAATFGIRAIAHVGLLDPLGQFYGYDGIVPHEGRWVISFRSSTCYRNEEVETCDPNTGTRDEHYPDAWLEITIDADRFVITDAFGRFTDEQESELRAYTEPATIEQTHLEFPTVRIDPSIHEEGWDVRAVILWAGPLYVPGVWSVCRPAVYDSENNLIWTGRKLAFGTRRGEYFRSNGLLGTGVETLPTDPARADMLCELWTQETWVMRTEPEVRRFPRTNSVTVKAPLVWRHDFIIGLDSRCLVELRRRNDSIMKSKMVRGPYSPWGGRARRETLYTQFRVDRPKVVASATVRCLARGQTF